MHTGACSVVQSKRPSLRTVSYLAFNPSNVFPAISSVCSGNQTFAAETKTLERGFLFELGCRRAASADADDVMV